MQQEVEIAATLNTIAAVVIAGERLEFISYLQKNSFIVCMQIHSEQLQYNMTDGKKTMPPDFTLSDLFSIIRTV